MKNHCNHKSKQKVSIILVIVMLFITACGNGNSGEAGNIQSSIDSATADIMRLELFEGDVYIKNGDGQDLEPFAGMRLQSGYSVETGADGFAFISLDSSKAIKLDASSASTIDYDGKDLLITLTFGELFFNVTSPLADDESMNIQTSNMITGIRGTSGIVKSYEKEGRVVSETTIITGEVVVNAIKDDADYYDDVSLPAGKTAYYDYEDDVDRITIVDASEDDLSDFALKSLSDEDDLLDEIEDFDNDLLREILDDYDADDDDDDDDGNTGNGNDGDNDDDDDDIEGNSDDDDDSEDDKSGQNSNSSSEDDEDDEEDDDIEDNSQQTPEVEDDEEDEEESSQPSSERNSTTPPNGDKPEEEDDD